LNNYFAVGLIEEIQDEAQENGGNPIKKNVPFHNGKLKKQWPVLVSPSGIKGKVSLSKV